MEKIRLQTRRFFSGLRLLLPLMPSFVWITFKRMSRSTIAYWKHSQKVVERIADDYMREALEEEKTTEYNLSLYKTCYAIASFLYLLCWLAMARLTVEAFRMLTSWIF